MPSPTSQYQRTEGSTAEMCTAGTAGESIRVGRDPISLAEPGDFSIGWHGAGSRRAAVTREHLQVLGNGDFDWGFAEVVVSAETAQGHWFIGFAGIGRVEKSRDLF